MREYRLVSADSHIVEPPDLFVARVPAALKQRAPHQIREERGDAWVVEGAPEPFPFGLNACGGLPPEAYRPWIRWEEVRPACYEPAARLGEMDAAGVDAEVLYPTPRIHNYVVLGSDAELQLASVRAYNDFMSEFCAHDPDRLAGIAMLPASDVPTALAELERSAALPGIRGFLVTQYPHARTLLSPEDDALFAASRDTGLPLHLHVGLAGSPAGPPALAHSFTGAFTGAFRFYDPPLRIAELIYNQVFDRFPELEIVFAEVDIGWVGYLREQLDDRYARQNPLDKRKLDLLPSGYFDRNLLFTLVKDRYGIRNRHEVGVDRILWSSDYPHATCDHPRYQAAIESDFAGVPEDELRKMLATNAARVYGWGETS